MHERFDQRCEISKSLRGRVRAFDVRWQGMARPGFGVVAAAAEAAAEAEEVVRKVDERAGARRGCSQQCVSVKSRDSPPRALARSFTCLLSFHLARHERVRSRVVEACPYAGHSRRGGRARGCITGHSLPHLLPFKRQNGLRCNSSNQKTRHRRVLPVLPSHFSPRYRDAVVWHVFPG